VVRKTCPPDDKITWDAFGNEVVALCLHSFVDPGDGAVCEYFGADWQPHSGVAARFDRTRAPVRVAWLLMRWARTRRNAHARLAAARLLQVGERHGVDPGRQVAVNALGGDLRVTDERAKLWPQDRTLKAWHEACAMGNPHARQAPQQLHNALQGLSRFLLEGPFGAVGRRSCGPDGDFEPQPCRASSLYTSSAQLEALHDVDETAIPVHPSLP